MEVEVTELFVDKLGTKVFLIGASRLGDSNNSRCDGTLFHFPFKYKLLLAFNSVIL